MVETKGDVVTRWAGVQPWVTLLLRIGIGALMVVAGMSKLPDPAAALRGVRAYRIVPESLVPTVAFGLPALEIVLGVALIAGLFVRQAGIAVGVLMVVFVAGIASAWARGLSIDCGCFGGGGEVAAGQTQYVQEILRDTGLFLGCAVMAVWPRSKFSVDGWLRGPQLVRVGTG